MNSKQVNETVNRLASLMQDVKDGDLRTILSNMQKMSDYMVWRRKSASMRSISPL